MDERNRSDVTLTPRQPLPERTNRGEVDIKTSVAPEDLQKLGDFAREIGASDAVAIEARAISVSEAMRLKCQIPTFWGYNSSPFCPPRSATADAMKSIIRDYEWALLVHIPRPSNGDGSYAKLIEHVSRVKEIVGRTEVEAQYSGFVDSMGFTGGPGGGHRHVPDGAKRGMGRPSLSARAGSGGPHRLALPHRGLSRAR